MTTAKEYKDSVYEEVTVSKGKIFKMHPEHRIGFAMNPKSNKYLGGNVKGSNFLGRLTYLTFPEFTKKQLRNAIAKKFPTLASDMADKFVLFYCACCETIEKNNVPVDLSIRQLLHLIELYQSGLGLQEAIEDGIINILDSISQPKTKESFMVLAQGTWTELQKKAPNKVLSSIVFKYGRKNG